MVSKCGDFKKQKFNEYPIDDRWWVKIAEHPEHAHDGKSMDDIAKTLGDKPDPEPFEAESHTKM